MGDVRVRRVLQGRAPRRMSPVQRVRQLRRCTERAVRNVGGVEQMKCSRFQCGSVVVMAVARLLQGGGAPWLIACAGDRLRQSIGLHRSSPRDAGTVHFPAIQYHPGSQDASHERLTACTTSAADMPPLPPATAPVSRSWLPLSSSSFCAPCRAAMASLQQSENTLSRHPRQGCEPAG